MLSAASSGEFWRRLNVSVHERGGHRNFSLLDSSFVHADRIFGWLHLIVRLYVCL